jgi:nitrogen regulatory protein PII
MMVRSFAMAFKCVVAMVKPDLTDRVVDAAKQAGATGATIVPASGTGVHEARSFFGLTLDTRTDILLFLLSDEAVAPVLDAVERAGHFSEPGTGIVLVVPVDRVSGLESQLNNE